MRLVTLHEPFCITLRKSAGVDICRFEAGKTYLMHGAAIDRLKKEHDKFRKVVYKVSDLRTRIAPFHLGAYKAPAKILFYNGSGGYGDAIMSWPVVKLMADMGFEVHVLADPGNVLCWFNFPWIKSLRVLPVELSYLDFFDGYALFETVGNSDEHQDQEHIVDKLLTMIGVDYRSVPPECKVCPPCFSPGEIQAGKEFLPDKMLAFYQLAATSKHRCFTPELSALVLRQLAEKFSQFHWVALYDGFIPPDFAKAAEAAKPDNVTVAQFPEIRTLWATMRRAELIVSPDSMSVHVAGCMGKRCVGLWGATDPKIRTRYYKHHFPVHKKAACPFAPCNTFHTGWPTYCPNREDKAMCDVMAAITMADVLAACDQALT